MSRDPTLEEDIDTMRDVYMSTKQREAYERIINRVRGRRRGRPQPAERTVPQVLRRGQ